MKHRLRPLVFLTFLYLVLITTVSAAPNDFGYNLAHNLARPETMAENMENFFSKHIPFSEQLDNLKINIMTTAGRREFDNIFISDNRLIAKLVPPTNSDIYKNNTKALKEFAKQSENRVAVMILPTAGAIYQELLPQYAAEIQFNQREFIERINKELSGVLTAVDAYPALFNARRDYIYYRTDSRLTTKGGLVVYNELAKRLGVTPLSESDFNVRFIETPFYGKLYDQWQYGGVDADNVMIYEFSRSIQLSIEHWRRYESKTYYNLYPQEAIISGNPLDVILGGSSPKINIVNKSSDMAGGSILVVGDNNAFSFLPFFAQSYERITIIDIELITEGELQKITTTDYDTVLFTFTLENYLNSEFPKKAALISTSFFNE